MHFARHICGRRQFSTAAILENTIVIVTVQLSDSLYKEIENFAKDEGITLDQFFVQAAVEKMSALRTVEYLRQEAAKGERVDFEAFLAALPDAPSQPDDVI
jgi:uncharacterized protein (DUF1778 family)